jgi:triphosphoribosyl-dephospho-CoA synthase
MLFFQHCLHSPQQIARFYAKIAVRALYDEVALYPKPGLVSFIDSGAHHNMDGSLFMRSLFSLRHYFFNLGLRSALGDPVSNLVPLGVQAEETMYRSTHGVNTHRGAIFSLGILCSTLCRLTAQRRCFNLDELHQAIIYFWSDYLQNHHDNKETHGALVKERYQVPDAKHLAIEGYLLVFTTYKALANQQEDKVFFGLLAYQQLLLALDDINVLYRVGPKGLADARNHIRHAVSIAHREHSIQAAIKVHTLFSQNNISPGGVADMLSFLYFLTYLFKPKTASLTEPFPTSGAQ